MTKKRGSTRRALKSSLDAVGVTPSPTPLEFHLEEEASCGSSNVTSTANEVSGKNTALVKEDAKLLRAAKLPATTLTMASKRKLRSSSSNGINDNGMISSTSSAISKRAKSISSSSSSSSASSAAAAALSEPNEDEMRSSSSSSSSPPCFVGKKSPPRYLHEADSSVKATNGNYDNTRNKCIARPLAERRRKQRGRKLILDMQGDEDSVDGMIQAVTSSTNVGIEGAAVAASKTKKGGRNTSNHFRQEGSDNEDTNRPDENITSYSVTATAATATALTTTTTATATATSGDEVEGNQPDGNGALNQPAPWIVEYSKTGRATCRSCDEKIVKGDVRVGHTPLFRGKPGYMVYRHLHCAVFSEEIQDVKDVEKYDTLKKDDYAKLVERVRFSQTKIHEEYDELRPDELVQGCYDGHDMRSEQPHGLNATLLPFQVEGYSWMYHQEVKQVDVRGGILADEMGMGKTIQTIATILDHRPKLQHTEPRMKHPHTAVDLKERQDEDLLWEKAEQDWASEMKLLKVPKKFIRSGHNGAGGGARAGTLVICPVIALTQWKTEIEKFTDDGSLTVCTYHGPDRASQTPRELMRKYDVVLTTYQVLEADFRKMTSPNRVECPNCGGKFKIDKLPIHLKYFCGETAERTEAQARQRRNSDRDGGHRNSSRSRRSRTSDSDSESGQKNMEKRKKKNQIIKLKTAPKVKTSTGKTSPKIAAMKSTPQKVSASANRIGTVTPRSGSQRRAALNAASKISRSAADWVTHGDDDDGSGNFKSVSQPESSSEDDDSIESSSSSNSDDSALERAREKQRQALEVSKAKGMHMTKKKDQPKAKSKGESKKKAGKLKGKKKKFDDESSSDSSTDDIDDDDDDGIDMEALVEKAMAGAKNSILHSLCWWRIILDEAHFIKTRSSQTANAAFSLTGIHRWCLSGTPLQNRVGEFYSLVRFLRLDPMGYYYCRVKDCTCKSMHYRMLAGICECCSHGGIQHYSHFNKYILNPIQRDGYSGDGRRAMFLLKNEVLDKAMLRRTKESRAADMELPPRLVQIKPVRLHPVEEDFYSALYTQTKTSFDSFVDSGTLLNNYAHIFDLLIRMRQSVDHPYLVIHSKKNVGDQESLSRQDGTDCELCHEPPTDRVVSTCCSTPFCRACVMEYMATSSGLSTSASLACPSCSGAFSIDLQSNADIEDDSSLKVAVGAKNSYESSSGLPSLKELQHVATGSILRRINLAEFTTSSKIEALTQELVMMRQTSPGSKAIVFSQFVNMLDLIRWRLHSDPYLEDIGLGCRALHGGMNVKARDDCLREFREDHNVRVLLMSLKAGGVALNLTCANHIFLMDPWWNPAAEMQAIDRTHRLGQYRPIRAVRFIAENTVEERILQLQEKKRLVFDGTVGRDAASLKMLTVDDMKSLFT